MLRLIILTTVLATTGTAALTAPALAADPTPAKSGQLKVHSAETAHNDTRDERKVCRFYLVAGGFGNVSRLRFRIQQSNAHSFTSVSGTVPLQNGSGRTGHMHIPDGEYTLQWATGSLTNPLGAKKFTVDCKSTPEGIPDPPEVDDDNLAETDEEETPSRPDQGNSDSTQPGGQTPTS